MQVPLVRRLRKQLLPRLTRRNRRLNRPRRQPQFEPVRSLFVHDFLQGKEEAISLPV